MSNRSSWSHTDEYKRKRLERIQKIAQMHGGVCLSGTYENAGSTLLFECARGHVFERKYNNELDKGSWCKQCKGIDKAEKMAAERGGHCLSNEYHGHFTVMEWECANGHRWKSKYDNVLHGNWCPICGKSYGEKLCKVIFEQLFHRELITVRPRWLIGEKGKPLEIDGYNDDLKLGFEYQGKQHYNGLYKGRQTDVHKVEQHDTNKFFLAQMHGVTLICIHYFPERCGKDRALQLVKDELKRRGVKYDKSIRSVNLSDVYLKSGKKYVTP